MWAEAFRSVEDIQALIALGKRQPKQQMMATYYRWAESLLDSRKTVFLQGTGDPA
jgi:hypothetical protein